MCAGTGKVKGSRGFFGNNTCPQCGGTGQAVEVCPAVPRRRHRHQAEASFGREDPGGRRGRPAHPAGRPGAGGSDLYLKVKVRSNPQYERHGDELRTEFPVPYTIAALGGEATVETLGGRKVLNVPAGTQSGQSFRLTGQGMPRLKGAGGGDLYAKAKITVPKDLSRASVTC